jgi:membrane-bound serine protease (ClpP class)
MLRRYRPGTALLLLAGSLLLTGCADPLVVGDPTGIAFVDRILAFLANPNVAYLLLVLGLLAIIAEVATPGAVWPGVVGSLMLLLSLFGLLQLPTNWFGVLLILSGVIMMLIDINVPGFVLSIGGIIAFLIGSLLLFARPAEMPLSAIPASPLNPLLAIGTTAAVGAFFLLGVAAAFRAHRLPVATGRETLLGKIGMARQSLEPVGIVHIEGEEWSAENVTGEYIPAGTRVRVVGLDGLRLKVEAEPDIERSISDA